MIMRAQSVKTLWRMLVSRNGRVVLTVSVAIGVLVALDVLRHGIRIDSMLAWGLGGSGMLAFAPALGIVREKVDGSLRFLAFLPIHGGEHALARALTALSLALPAGLLLALGLQSLIPEATAVMAALAGISLWLVLAVGSLLFTALQLRTVVGRGPIVGIYVVVAVIVAAQMSSTVKDRPWFRAAAHALASPAGIAAASTIVWALIIGAAVFSLRSIALEGPRYRGEPAEQ